MCLLRLLDVKISVSFLMVVNFGSKFAFASHDREKPWSILYLGLFCVTYRIQIPQPDKLFAVFGLILFSFSGGLVILFSIR